MRFLLTLALGLFFTLNAFAQTTQRAIRPTFASGNMGLEIGGVAMGAVRSMAGGAIYGDVIRSNAGSGQVGKRIGQVRYEPIVLEVGTEMSPAFWDLIRKWPALPNSGRLNGAVLFADLSFKQTKRLEFTNAVITEIELPTLDARDGKSLFTLRVTLQPEKIESRPGKGNIVSSPGKAKQLLCSNFRLVMDGVDFLRVSKVEGFSIKQKVVEKRIGELRRNEVEAGAIEYGDLVLTLSETGSASVEAWFQEAVIKGTGKEREGRLELLGADLKSVVATIFLRGVGIWKLGMAEVAANSEAMRMVEARLYVESATVDMK